MCEIHAGRVRLWRALAGTCRAAAWAAVALGCGAAVAALWRPQAWPLAAVLALVGLAAHLGRVVCRWRGAAAAGAADRCPMCRAQRTAWV